jgi:predicted RecA/RadA family phage recombinase
MADYQPLFNPGKAYTRQTSAAVVGGQLLVISGSGTVAPATVATHSWLGVAAFDAASGANVTVFSEGVQRLVATGSITAGSNVEAAAAGTVAAHANGTNDQNILGVALTTVTTGQLVEVSLSR